MVKKKQNIKSISGEVSKLIKKEFDKKVKLEAKKRFNILQQRAKLQQAFKQRPISASIQQAQIQQAQIQQVQSQKRQRSFSAMVGRAEQLEIEMVSLDEVPMLMDVERQRMRAGSPNTRRIIDIEKEVTDSFAD